MKSNRSKSVFITVKDEELKKQILVLVGGPSNTKEIFFWRNDEDETLGLTLKSDPNEPDLKWGKLSLYGKIGGDMMKPSKESQFMINSVYGETFYELVNIYKKLL